MQLCKQKVLGLRLLSLIVFLICLFILFSPTNVNATKQSNKIWEHQYVKIEKNDGSGEVMQYSDGKISWGKWSGDKSQVWYLPSAGEGLRIQPRKGEDKVFLFWDKDIMNPNDYGKLSFGKLEWRNEYTSKWIFKRNADGTYGIFCKHYPKPGLVVAGDTVDLSFGGGSAFKISKDLSLPKPETHSIVFTSDPQYPWTDKMDRGEPEPNPEANSAALIREQYKSVNAYNSTKSSSKVIINGDITAFGHQWQWKKMEYEFFPILNKAYYFGLGNHDIENNQGGCFEDSCFTHSLNRLSHHVKTSSNVLFSDVGGIRSYSYAVKLPGNILLLQLNNYPTMSYQAMSWTGPLQIGVKPNFVFIENVLNYAKNNQMKVLIGVHKPNDWRGGASTQFIQLIEKYNVKAIFAGHYHKYVGKYYSADYFGNVPVFLSGGATQKSFLITEYDEQNLNIYKVQNNAWRNKELIEQINLKN